MLKTPSPHPCLLPGLNFTHEFSSPHEQHRGTGNGGCGQFITRRLCCSFLLTLCPCSSMDLSHRRQFCMNCSNVGPFHEVQSFRNRLLQCGSPTGSQALPANLLQRGLLSQWVHRSCQEPAPAWAPLSTGPQVLPGACSSAGSSLNGSTGPARSLLQRGLPTGSQLPSGIHLLRHEVPSTWATGGYLLHCGLLHGLQGNLCPSAWSTSSLSFTDLGACRVVPLTSSHSTLRLRLLCCAVAFFPILTMLSQRRYHRP